jgi:hypothetical protein
MPEREHRLRALVTAERKDLIHNDLANAAFYLKERVVTRDAADDRDGIFLDMMAAAAMTAFAFEAYLNFLGTAKVVAWKDRAPILAKLDILRTVFGIAAPQDARPYSTVRELIGLRNTLAHGQPHFTKIRKEAEGTHSELMELVRPVQPEWERMLTPDFVVRAYEDVEGIWRQMLDAADIDIFETASVIGPYGLELRGKAEGEV